MSNFILMLTKDDVTVPDALDRVSELRDTGIQHIGFKDVGLPLPQMRSLTAAIRDIGCAVHLEVVSLDEASELDSARAALSLGVDFLLGGTSWEKVAPLARDAGIAYFPYVGEVRGHPATLNGTADSILADVDEVREHVTGVNLLAFRHSTLDGLSLVNDLVRRVDPLPVVCAGSIASLGRAAEVTAAGVWGFTIGGAVIDRLVVPGGSFVDQVTSLMAGASTGQASAHG